MTCIMCTTRPGDERVAQQMLSTGPARMSTETCTVMTWKNSCKQTGEFHKTRKQTLVVVDQKSYYFKLDFHRLLHCSRSLDGRVHKCITLLERRIADDQIPATNFFCRVDVSLSCNLRFSVLRFQPDKEFAGTDRTQRRDGPVQFEEDPFGLDKFLTEAKKGKRPLDEPSRSRYVNHILGSAVSE